MLCIKKANPILKDMCIASVVCQVFLKPLAADNSEKSEQKFFFSKFWNFWKFCVNGFSHVVERRRPENDSGSSESASQSEKPEKEAIQNHRYKLPVFNHLRWWMKNKICKRFLKALDRYWSTENIHILYHWITNKE